MAEPKKSREDKTTDARAGTNPPQPGTVTWNEAAMATHFANVVNVQSTREQVDLFFGTNKSWNPTGENQIVVDLSNRIILTPFAARRLLSVLGNVMSEYETRYGSLGIEQ